jgi:hypothetical protein
VSVVKIGVAGAAGEDDDAVVLQMVDGLPADIGLADLRDVDRTHHAGAEAFFLESALEGQGVDDGAKHPHVIAGRALDPDLFAQPATVNVAGSDDDPHMDAHAFDFFDDGRHRFEFFGVEDRFVAPVGEGFAGEFEDNGLIDGFHTASYYTKKRARWVRVFFLSWLG